MRRVKCFWQNCDPFSAAEHFNNVDSFAPQSAEEFSLLSAQDARENQPVASPKFRQEFGDIGHANGCLRDLRIEIEKRLEHLVRRNDCPI
jgi:hypothetical protein